MEQFLTQKFILKATSIVRCDRDRKIGGVACYIKHNIYFSTKYVLPKNIEVIFVDLLLPFLQLLAEILNSLNILENEIFVLGDININILQNGVNLLEKNANTPKGKVVISPDVKNCIEFCSTRRSNQLIKVPTRITSNTFTLISHILIYTP